MGKWFDKIIDKILGWPTAAEEVNYDRDLEAKVLDIRRRIEEQRKWIGYYTPQSGTSKEHEQVDEPIQDLGRIQKNAELDALKSKLLGKKK